MRYALLMVLLLVACGDSPKPRVKRVTQSEPVSKTYKLGSDQITVVDMPDAQRCYVYKDSEYRMASMQCPSDASSETYQGVTTEKPHY